MRYRGIRFSAEDDFAANYHKFSKTVLSDISALGGMITAAKRMTEKGDARWKKVYDMIQPLQRAQAVFYDRVNTVVTYVTRNNMIDNR